MTTLYERWRQIACEHASEAAIFAPEPLTFGELARCVDATTAAGTAAFPTGHNVNFIKSVLVAWKCGQVVCPLESDQPKPAVSPLPPGIAHLKLTSATTGPARLVAFTQEQLFADAQNIVATMGLRPQWPNVGFISLAHSYGFSNLVLPLALFGIPLILAHPPLPEVFRRVAKQHQNITLPAVPALWQAWHEAGALSANVRLAISAGAPLPLALEADVFHTTGVKIHNFYGASECGGIAYDRSNKPRTEGALAGTALENVQLSRTSDGVLEVRGPAVGETYWPQPDPRLDKRRFETADLVDIKEAQIFLRGRASDLINVAGRKVSPEVIESELLRHAAVRDCVVFGATNGDSGRGELIAACVVGAVTERELRDFLTGRLPAWQVPRKWHFMEALPRNERGKLSRADFRKRLT